MTPAAPPARYLALGDSYTICTGASSPAHRWPNLFAALLSARLDRHVEVINLGVDGCTTAELIEHQLPHLGDASWEYISILIGVNDYYQGYDEPSYHSRLVQVYEAIAAVPRARVLAVSIPDYSYTPVGSSSGDPQSIVDGLRLFNASAKVTAESRGFTWVDIFDVSRVNAGAPGWIAADGLHPGDLQYQVWTERIWSVMESEALRP